MDLEEFEVAVKSGWIQASTPVRFPGTGAGAWVRAGDTELFQGVLGSQTQTTALRLSRFPVLSGLFCAVQLAVFFLLAGGERGLDLDTLIAGGAKIDANILELGETWRLWTANLLHRDLLHLLFNTFFLFNIGGAVENVYRPSDYILIVLVSGLGTTGLSLGLSSVPSVGSSGVVLGLFGSASVFGYVRRREIPRKYRRYFGASVIPYILFILYVGLASRETDNWGHLGGLLSGSLVAFFLTRRSPPRDERCGWRDLVVLGSGMVLVVGVVALGWMVRLVGPKLEPFANASSGLTLSRPVRWTVGENHLGDAAWGNRLGVSLGMRAELGREEPVTLDDVRSAFLRELRRLERSGELVGVRVASQRPVLIPGARGLELEVQLESRAGPQITRNLLLERGFHEYRIVLSVPRDWAEAYSSVFDQLVAEIRLVEPAQLMRAREVARVFPGMSSAQVELGDQYTAVGDRDRAADAYRRALRSRSDDPEALYGRARLSLVYGGDLQAAEQVVSDLWGQRPTSVPVVTLLADLRKRLARPVQACRVLASAMGQHPEPPQEILSRWLDLGCPQGPTGER